MVANDTTAGYGMFAGPASAHLVGLRVVLGTGEVLRAGASSLYRGLPAFSRSGLPDFSGLFLASEGALGIVTEMTLRIKPLSPRRVLILRYAPSRAAFEGSARLARDLRSARICAHWVNVSRLSPEEDETRIELEGELGPEELERRCAWLAARLRRLGLPGPERTENEPARWFGGERPRRWTGVSVSAPYGNISRIQSLWLKRWRPRARRLTEGEAGLRTYFGLEGTAALLWWRRREGLERESARFEAAARRDLARLGLPYRLGRAWGEAAKARLDPAYRRRLRWLKRCFDPKGIMNPGVGAF
ncbi:MAG: FAD-binding oxidoreductase, partial [Elusimicrobia bacterium]|nr:FAD-binding oxidoreductase [Elusimicrobiota bacterium]